VAETGLENINEYRDRFGRVEQQARVSHCPVHKKISKIESRQLKNTATTADFIKSCMTN